MFAVLRANITKLCLGLDTISIGLQTTEESRPLDSSTAVITLRFLPILYKDDKDNMLIVVMGEGVQTYWSPLWKTHGLSRVGPLTITTINIIRHSSLILLSLTTYHLSPHQDIPALMTSRCCIY